MLRFVASARDSLARGIPCGGDGSEDLSGRNGRRRYESTYIHMLEFLELQVGGRNETEYENYKFCKSTEVY